MPTDAVDSSAAQPTGFVPQQPLTSPSAILLYRSRTWRTSCSWLGALATSASGVQQVGPQQLFSAVVPLMVVLVVILISYVFFLETSEGRRCSFTSTGRGLHPPLASQQFAIRNSSSSFMRAKSAE